MSHEQVEVKTAAPLHLQQWRVQLLFLLWLMLYRTSHTWYTSFVVSILLPCFLILLLSLSYLNKDVFFQVCYFSWSGLRASYASMYCSRVFFRYFFQFPTLLFFVYCVLQNAPYIHTCSHLPFSSNAFSRSVCYIIRLP